MFARLIRWMFGLCPHEDAVCEHHRFDSILEKTTAARASMRCIPKESADSLTCRGVISIIRCDKCGRIAHIRTRL